MGKLTPEQIQKALQPTPSTKKSNIVGVEEEKDRDWETQVQF